MSYYQQLLDGRKRRRIIYVTPDDFLKAAADYFKWCEEHPIIEEQVNVWQGVAIRTELEKVRPFTKKGFATYLGISENRLKSYLARGDEWAEAAALVEQVIYTQKFENAAAGLLNANIITRELGLAEKQEVTGADGGPLEQVVQYQLPSNGRD